MGQWRGNTQGYNNPSNEPSGNVQDPYSIRADSYNYQDLIVSHIKMIAMALPRYITTGAGMEAMQMSAMYYNLVILDSMLIPYLEDSPEYIIRVYKGYTNKKGKFVKGLKRQITFEDIQSGNLIIMNKTLDVLMKWLKLIVKEGLPRVGVFPAKDTVFRAGKGIIQEQLKDVEFEDYDE